KACALPENPAGYRHARPESDLFNKAACTLKPYRLAMDAISFNVNHERKADNKIVAIINASMVDKKT
ncbi:hypothetical protein, partial [Pantoea dispersa]|uniref:hypothetical protein n=1 Tax=Pantoea dispersa TaxID=59814 RepID=UPI001639AD4F